MTLTTVADNGVAIVSFTRSEPQLSLPEGGRESEGRSTARISGIMG